MEPAQIISLMEMGGPTFAMSDHDDHIHVGYTPDGTDSSGQPITGLLKPDQWDKLLDRISELDQPDGARSSLPSTRCPPRRATRRATLTSASSQRVLRPGRSAPTPVRPTRSARQARTR